MAFYGITEIAAALDLDGQLVTVWRRRETVLRACRRLLRCTALVLESPVRATLLSRTWHKRERQKAARQWRDEARHAGTVDHPGVLKIHDAGVLGDVAWLAMDELTGPDLKFELAF